MVVNGNLYISGIVYKMPRYLLASALILAFGAGVFGQGSKVVLSEQEKPIVAQLRGLRGLPDDVRAKTTLDLALAIRHLPESPNRLSLAVGLANLSTEGDFGHQTLQEVANTLADAIREKPPAKDGDKPAFEYMELAQLVKYEHVQTSMNDAQFREALQKLTADDEARQQADLVLEDLSGKSWSLKDLRGKVVLVNFWATWCPPCRKEMPDLDALYQRFREQGLVVLAISDEERAKVTQYLAQHPVSYTILLDPGRNVNDAFRIDGIPKTFVYDREGKLAAEGIDMRTREQFLGMLEGVGIR